MADMDELFGSDEGQGADDKDQARATSNGVLAFHNGTEESLYCYVKNRATQGDPRSVLQAIDDFCYSQHWMMHVGDKKQPLLDLAISKARENTVGGLCTVELGAYCGYSAVYLASKMSAEAGDHLYSVELKPSCVAWTKRMVEYAGLSHLVTVIESSAGEYQTWRTHLTKPHIDLLFIDHDKTQYLKDLQTLQAAQMLRSGTVVVADNVLTFGQRLQGYLEYVRDPAGPFASSELHSGFIEYAAERDANLTPESAPDLVDGLEISILR
jgi:catechol O-methyltransferase